MWSHINLNNFGPRAQKFIDATKISLTALRKFPQIWISILLLENHARYWCNKNIIDGFSTAYISSCLNIYPVIYRACLRVSTTRRFILIGSFFSSAFESTYLKYIKDLQSRRKFELIISNDIWTHVFRYEFWSYIFIFLVTYLA